MSDDLLDRLNAALDERERLARAATPGPWHALDGGVVDDDHEQWPVADTDSKHNREDRVFIAANDPTHVLRVITAHREVLRHHFKTPAEHHPGYDCAWCRYHWPCFDVENIASVYVHGEG